MLEEKVNIAIDGLSVTGKDTITKILNYVLNNMPAGNSQIWSVIDSSAMYRVLGLFIDEHYKELGMFQLSKIEKIEKAIEKITKSKKASRLFRIITGYEKKVRDITEKLNIDTNFLDETARVSGLEKLGFKNNSVEYAYKSLRSTHVDTLAGYIAKFTSVRPIIVDMEREYAKDGYYLVLGRDGYSVVLQGDGQPKSFGLYPWANFEKRVERRWKERGGPKDLIIDEIVTRDSRDTDPKSNNVPGDMDIAVKRGYNVFDNSEMDVYQMGQEAVRIALGFLEVELQPDIIRDLVHRAVTIYNLK